eukprot:GGOE01018876.1.p1 GENE.GGOE01018876.1~~GGOE01018876.1.p1  ORF type:complete len:423 (+),score=83.32 GGOE01018876.1:147-1271(+)
MIPYGGAGSLVSPFQPAPVNFGAPLPASWGSTWPPPHEMGSSSLFPTPTPSPQLPTSAAVHGNWSVANPSQASGPPPTHPPGQPGVPTPAPYPPAPFPPPPPPQYPPPHTNQPGGQPAPPPVPHTTPAAPHTAPQHEGLFLPPFNGKKLAVLAGVDPEDSDAASRGCSQMEAFLGRNGYTSSTILFGDDWAEFRLKLDRVVRDLLQHAQQGDNLVFYCIGYDATAVLRQLVDKLPRSVRLVCIFDCCYVTEKPAYRISPTPGGNRVAQPMAAITDQPLADVILFEGTADIRCVAWFKSAKGNTPLYTAGFIRALSRGPEGYWGPPTRTSFIQLCEDVETEIASIVHRLPKDALPRMTSLISCTRAYNVDQLFVL